MGTLFDMRPSLELFECGLSKLEAVRPTNWEHIADAIDTLLLSQWEARCCDEVFRRCEATVNADVSLQVLHAATAHAKAWRGHAAACDRAVTVLIAALNAVLRAHRNKVRALL